MAPAAPVAWHSRPELTDAAIDIGTRYRMEFASAPSVISDCARFERPSVWELVGRSNVMTSGWPGRLLPRGDDGHLPRLELQLYELPGLAAPLVRRRIRPELERDIPISRRGWKRAHNVAEEN